MTKDFEYKAPSLSIDIQGFKDNLFRKNRFWRAFIVMQIITVLLGINALRLVQLQIIQGVENRQKAENNRVRLVPLMANRGRILDRNGQTLAATQLSSAVYVWPREESVAQWKITARQLGNLLNMSPETILEQIEKHGFKSAVPLKLRGDLDYKTIIALTENSTDLPGIEIRVEPSRFYPYQNLASHILGYIGAASLDELKAHPEYPMGTLTGKMGIESHENNVLQGVAGNRLIEVNAQGEEIKELGMQQAIAGKPVKLTIDLALQKTTEEAMKWHQGAAVAMNVKTGEILALVSKPDFDPNLFTGKMSQSQWTQLQASNKPFLNRALQGYPPGSTFKIVTTAAALNSGMYYPEDQLYSYSSINIGGISFNEHGEGYGLIGFPKALAVSSNTFFYQVGTKTGPDNIAKWGKELGLAGKIDLDLLGLDGANHGQIPTPAEKMAMYGEPWHIADTVTMGIGQGLVLVTPVELATMISTIVNGGYRVQPHLLSSLTNTAKTQPIKTNLSPASLNVIKNGLVEVVKNGTGRSLNDGSIPLTGGKTGTVEIPGQPDNAMYVAYGPADNPQIAIAVVVEQGGYGAVSAIPVAHEMFKTYFKKR
jgi:penicillin-binding protein 2